MNQRDLEDLVREVSRPAPSPGLRDRVLSVAVVSRQRISWSDRMWFSRGWRLTAVGAALMVVVLDQLSGSPRAAVLTATPQSVAEARAIDEVGREMGLPPDVVGSIARRALSDSLRTRLAPQSASELLEEFTRAVGGG